MKKKAKVTVLTSGMVLKGLNVVKNGLDTNRLVNLIVRFKSSQNFKIAGFQFPPDLFYIHKVSFGEAVGILINKFNYNPKEAILIVREWRDAFQTREITRDEISKSYEKIVENINNELVKQKGAGYKIGEQDITIIAGFKKENITLVHVKDKGFEETCKKLDIQVIPTPKRDIQKEEEIKKKLNRV